MELLTSIWMPLVSVAALFILTKLMGNRQMSQLSMFDYVMGISIGSIAAEMAANPDAELLRPLMGMAVYAGVDVGINLLNNRSRKARAIFQGKPVVLYDSGTLYYRNLIKAKLDLTELLAQCRNSGYFDLSQLQMVLMEVNGKLSFLPNEGERPLTPSDMRIAPPKKRPAVPRVMDGVLLPERRKATGNDQNWLNKQLTLQGFTDCGDILLATVDADNNFAVYERDEEKADKDLYS